MCLSVSMSVSQYVSQSETLSVSVSLLFFSSLVFVSNCVSLSQCISQTSMLVSLKIYMFLAHTLVCFCYLSFYTLVKSLWSLMYPPLSLPHGETMPQKNDDHDPYFPSFTIAWSLSIVSPMIRSMVTAIMTFSAWAPIKNFLKFTKIDLSGGFSCRNPKSLKTS